MTSVSHATNYLSFRVYLQWTLKSPLLQVKLWHKIYRSQGLWFNFWKKKRTIDPKDTQTLNKQKEIESWKLRIPFQFRIDLQNRNSYWNKNTTSQTFYFYFWGGYFRVSQRRRPGSRPIDTALRLVMTVILVTP